MTIVVIEAVKLRYSDAANETEMFQIVADSRISRDGVTSGDVSPKIMPISLICSNEHNQKRTFQLYGFCFAGGVIAALNTHAMAQYLLTNLFNNDLSAAPPSVGEVAQIYADIATIQIKEIGGRLPPEHARYAIFEGLIVGFSGGKSRAFHIRPVMAPSFNIELSELNLQGGLFRMGDGSLNFDKIKTDRQVNGLSDSAQVVVEEMIRSRASPSVGGFMQLAKVDHEGFNQLALLEILDGEKFAELTILGVDITEISRPIGYKFAQQAHSAGDLARQKMERGEEIHTRT